MATAPDTGASTAPAPSSDDGEECKPKKPKKPRSHWKPQKPKKPKDCADTGGEQEPPPTTAPSPTTAPPATQPSPVEQPPSGTTPLTPPPGPSPAGPGSGDGDTTPPPGSEALPPPSEGEALPPPLGDGDGRSGRQAVIDAARSFTALFVLAALVAAFLAWQGRFTRRDPKLSESPVDRDYLDFG
ncbi:MAG TPA: hypothetical protein VMQ81_05370 [Acidimicrobiia bacterium]|nr:hypothetical protein [Acidimicrobiia bacterium]